MLKETMGNQKTQPGPRIKAMGFKASTILQPNSINTTNSLSQIKTLSSEEMFLISQGNNRINSNRKEDTLWAEESLEPLVQSVEKGKEVDVCFKSMRMVTLSWSKLQP